MFFIKRSFIVTGLFFLLYSFAIFTACKDIHRNKSHPEVSYSDIEKGKVLAGQYCQSCHVLPDPSLLDAKTWETGILPAMGPRLGIFYYNDRVYPSLRYDKNLEKNFYPDVPILSFDQWQNIIDYYTASSPDTLLSEQNPQPAINNQLTTFLVKTPAFTFSTPAITMVKADEEGTQHGLLMSDPGRHIVYRLNDKLQVADSISVRGAIVDMEYKNKQWLTCNIGVLNPNNGKYGSGYNVVLNSAGKMQKDTTALFDSLQRPVQISAADLNNDGKTDYVVCEFGYQTGALSWMENKGNGKFERHVLRPLPGAIKAYIQDYNHDGLPDLWVLFAQGEEGIFLFTNKGNGHFDQREVLRFPPVYGSSSFELADFNNDGHPDIMYTCGDNGDYSTILKPYHGVYIFMNDGNNNFKQQYFFHINGCYKAIARDFDNDGDADIATISFFADYLHKPEEGFVYLENKGNLQFDPFSLPQTQQGRWLTMDAGDVNGDGKMDLILGNFSVGPTLIKSKYDWKKGPPFMILENIAKKHL